MFCTFVLDKGEEIEQCSYQIIFTNEVYFNLNGKVNRYIVQIGGLEDLRLVVEHERDSLHLTFSTPLPE